MHTNGTAAPPAAPIAGHRLAGILRDRLTGLNAPAVLDFFADVIDERHRQDARFGRVCHDGKTWLAKIMVWTGKFAAAILLGESVGLRRRAVQVAAMMCGMVEMGAATPPAFCLELDGEDWAPLSEATPERAELGGEG